MKDEFEVVVQGHSYLLKRMKAAGVPVTYHIHTDYGYKRVIFRFRKKSGAWKLVAQFLPPRIMEAEVLLGRAISHNEQEE